MHSSGQKKIWHAAARTFAPPPLLWKIMGFLQDIKTHNQQSNKEHNKEHSCWYVKISTTVTFDRVKKWTKPINVHISRPRNVFFKNGMSPYTSLCQHHFCEKWWDSFKTLGGFICTISLLSSLSFTFQTSKFKYSSRSKWQLKWLSQYRCQFRCQFTVPQKR